MFEAFQKEFLPDEIENRVLAEAELASVDDRLDQLFALFGGISFNQGLYRIISVEDGPRWEQRVSAAFPNFAAKVTCFGIDWLGRVFALDRTRQVDGAPGVVLLEPGTGEVLEIPCDIATFHEVELIQYSEEALAKSFYKQWRSQGGAAPRINQCVGYRRPLFLGGTDTTDNLELSDLEVYWEIMGQLLEKTRGLPVGTPVQQINIS